MFASDIGLLTLEPNLFSEVGWSGQRLLSTNGTLSNTTLTLPGTDLAASSIDAGCVILMSGVPLEVMERLTSTTLKVSLVRWGRTGPAIPPVGMTSGLCEVWTFRPQIAVAHRLVLRLIGVSEGTPPNTRPGSDAQPLGESAVVNSADFTTLEALLTLHIIYAAAGASAPGGSALIPKADQYRKRGSDERTRMAALIDTDGDGLADATRRTGIIPLIRV